MINGVFTTIKVKKGIPLFFEHHKTRLFSNAKQLKLHTTKLSYENVTTFLQKPNVKNCSLKITLTDSKIALVTRPLPKIKHSIKLLSITDPREKNKTVKTTDRSVFKTAINYAKKNGADDAVFVSKKDLIESTICNIFSLNIKGQIITPPLAGQGLEGIARKIIMQNLPVIEEKIPEDTTGPLVLTNSLRVQKVTYLNGKKLQNAEELFQKIKTIIEKLENEEIEMRAKQTIDYEKLSAWIDPETVFINLFADKSQSFWLDSSMTNSENRFSYMGIPSQTITYNLRTNTTIVQKDKTIKKINQNIFSYLKKQLIKQTTATTSSLPFPFVGGYIGYFGYELKSLTGAKSSHQSPYPDSLWYFTENFIAFDHHTKEVYLVCLTKNKLLAKKWFAELQQTKTKQVNDESDKQTLLNFHFSRNKNHYIKDIQTCQKYLAKGESYQICLTTMLTAEKRIEPFTLYQTLRKINPAPYATYLKYYDLAIACSSPEQFLKISHDGFVQTKPIKGTIKRGETKREDQQLLKTLQTSKKDWSENAMIVDLLRNDLGKVCEFGSVKVAKAMEIESYQTVHQLVSTVTGTLKKNISVIDCITACFPGGSMTGAPKIHTMEILDGLEKQARGIYSGAMGYLSLNQATTLNIVIRTIIMQKEQVTIGAGGAILIDSVPEKEYDEMLLKTKALMQALEQTSKTHTVFLALGSNVGDKKQQIQTAVENLGKQITEIKVAKLYETKPMYYEQQNNFINTVLRGQTNLTPVELLHFIKSLEKEIGRKKRFHNGPREIDIDILFYDDIILKNETLQIPHPLIQERDFVLKPFMDIDPNFVHPIFKKTIKEL